MIRTLNLKTSVSALTTQLLRTPQRASSSAQLTETGMQLDGQELLHVETRNMCRCEKCLGKHSHTRPNLPFQGSNFPDVRAEEIGRVSDHYVSVRWSDGHEGLIARTLRGNYGPEPLASRVGNLTDLIRRRNKEQVFWTGPDPEGQTKFWDWDWVTESSDNTREFLIHYIRYGIAFLTNIPLNLEMKEILHDGLGIVRAIRKTVFPEVDIVRFKNNPTNSGYGTGALPGHTDLCYYNQTPHVQYFHCLENTVKGGESFWVDAFSVVREMQETVPEFVERLRTIPMTYRFSPPGTGTFQITNHPIFNFEKLHGDIHQVIENPWTMDTPMFVRTHPLETRMKWWEAYLHYRSLIEDCERWYERKLNGGEFVLLDNWRVYHGRKEFWWQEGQERVVATSYMDWNHMASRIMSTEKGDHAFLEIDQH